MTRKITITIRMLLGLHHHSAWPGATAPVARLPGVQAGAAKVYAMEASNMADFARMLAAANPGEPASARISTLHCA